MTPAGAQCGLPGAATASLPTACLLIFEGGLAVQAPATPARVRPEGYASGLPGAIARPSLRYLPPAAARARGSLLGVVARAPPVHDDHRLVAHHPRVVALGQRGDVTGPGIELGAVGHDDMQRALHVVLEVRGLAQVGARERLDMVGPAPPRLQGEPPDVGAADSQQVEGAPVEGAGLVGRAEALLLRLRGHGVSGHGGSPFPPGRAARGRRARLRAARGARPGCRAGPAAGGVAGRTDEADRRQGAGKAGGGAAAARVALSLLRGSGPGPAPGEWAQLRLAVLERLAARARRVAAIALLEAGDWMAACGAAEQALDHDPYDEAALRILLRGHVWGGPGAAARARYPRARQRLADDLGTDPSPETAALFTAILRGELAPPAPAPASGSPGVVGRDGELASLDAVAMRARTGRVEGVVVDGDAGIGKTALVRAWAARREAAGDTVLVASCGPLDRGMPLDALFRAPAALLRRLGPDRAADLLGPDEALLGPLLALAPAPRLLPVLTDGLLGPAVLYAALLRVLRRLSGTGPVVVVIDDAH